MQTPEDIIHRAKKYRALLLRHITPEVISALEDILETNLPAFQGQQGTYDPLDAMRRDAHREVVLILKHHIALAKKENTNLD